MGALFSFFMAAAAYRPRLYFAESTASIRVRRSAGSKELHDVHLSTLIPSECPTLLTRFHPAWWLKGGHLQTFYSAVGDFSQIDKVEYDRTLLRTVDGGTLGLDFTGPPHSQDLPEETPIIVVLHGLTGGSHESYVRAVLAPACTPVEKGGLGYRAVVVNFRGCAGVPLTSPQLYSGGTSDDIRVALMYISSLFPKAPLLGLGFSLGANVLTRYLVEEGEHSRLNAGCVLASPWNFVHNIEALHSTWFRRMIYSRSLGQNLVTLTARHAETLSKFPDTPMGKALPTVVAMKRPLISTFDDHMTCVAGGPYPPFPFATARDYYVWASTDKELHKIRVPTLAINSADDPLVPKVPVNTGRYVLSPWVAFYVTEDGGHLGWFEQTTLFGVKRWITKPVLEWLRLSGDLMIDNRRMKPLREVDGFTKEMGRDDIGYRKIEGGGHVVGVEGQDGLLAGL